jgi:hypothetical protein
MKTYPHEVSNAVLLTATPGTSGLDGFVKGMTYLMSVLPEMTDWGLTGHMLMQRFTFSGSMNAPGKEMKDIFGYLQPISQKLWDLGVILIYIPIPDSINSYLIAKDWDVNSLTTSQSEGYPMVQSSRLLGRSGLKDTVNMGKALKYYFENNYIVEPFNVAGGAVARNTQQMALNPAWRQTVVHMSILPLGQLLSKTVGEVEDFYKTVQKDTEYLDKMSIDSGSYLNEVRRKLYCIGYQIITIIRRVILNLNGRRHYGDRITLDLQKSKTNTIRIIPFGVRYVLDLINFCLDLIINYTILDENKQELF